MSDPVAVRVEPLGTVVLVRPGEVLLDAAWRAQLDWPTTCFGQAECMACRVEVVSGRDAVLPPESEEVAAMRSRLPASQVGEHVRLACRMQLSSQPLGASEVSEVVVRLVRPRRSRMG